MPKKRSQSDVVAGFIRVHGDRYDYSQVQYLGSEHKVRVICKTHGPFEVLPGHHIKGTGCRHCYFDSNRKGLTEFIKRCNKAHGSRFDYSRIPATVRTTDTVQIHCVVHNEWFEQLASAHMRGHVGCGKCLSNMLSGPKFLRGKFKAEDLPLTDFVTRARGVHGNAYSYDRFRYESMNRKGEIVCQKHGSFYQTPSNHLRGTGCPSCTKENQYAASFKAECQIRGSGYWRALKRREAGMSSEQILSADLLRSERRVNPVTVNGVTYPNLEEAARILKPPASTQTVARWIKSGMTPEEAFARVPNPGYANGVIYLIEHLTTGRKYVGLTIVFVTERWRQHVEHAMAGHIKNLDSLHAAIREHGAHEFRMTVIDTGTTKLDLERKERYWIAKLGTLAPNGFNICPGGGSGGAMGYINFLDGNRFTTKRERAAYLATKHGISFEAARGRVRSGREDVAAPSKPGHAICKTPAYKAWSRIVHCATNPNSKDFMPGVPLHPDWTQFQRFLRDVGQPIEKGQVLARLDKSKGFTPDNCRWMNKSDASKLNAAQMKLAGTLTGRRMRPT